MSILRDVVPGDPFPKEVVRRRRLWDAEAIDLDVSERICLLET